MSTCLGCAALPQPLVSYENISTDNRIHRHLCLNVTGHRKNIEKDFFLNLYYDVSKRFYEPQSWCFLFQYKWLRRCRWKFKCSLKMQFSTWCCKRCSFYCFVGSFLALCSSYLQCRLLSRCFIISAIYRNTIGATVRRCQLSIKLMHIFDNRLNWPLLLKIGF